MPYTPPIYTNDGYVAWGTQKVTIGGTLYTLKAGNLKIPAKRLANMDELGREDAQSFVGGTPTNDVTLILPSTGVGAPAQFSEFAFKRLDGSTMTMIVTEPGEATTQDGVSSVTCQCYAKIN